MELREEHWILHRDRETGKVRKMERVATEWHREEPADHENAEEC